VALRYFTLSFSRDRSIMPVAVQAIDKYGWEESFYGVWMVQNLPQTNETLLWLVGQADGPGRLPQSAISDIPIIFSTLARECDVESVLAVPQVASLAGGQGLLMIDSAFSALLRRLMGVPGHLGAHRAHAPRGDRR
jgi:hypothetical protein